jgi:hypothetical protein
MPKCFFSCHLIKHFFVKIQILLLPSLGKEKKPAHSSFVESKATQTQSHAFSYICEIYFSVKFFFFAHIFIFDKIFFSLRYYFFDHSLFSLSDLHSNFTMVKMLCCIIECFLK